MRAMNKKTVFAFAVLLMLLLLVGAAIVDGKSKGGGGGRSSGSSSKGFSSALSSSSAKDTVAKAVGISTLPALAKSTKKHDLFENETENDTAEKSPNVGVVPVFLAAGMLFMAWRYRNS